MSKEEFDESWPAWSEGHNFVNKDRWEDLLEPKAKPLWISVPWIIFCLACAIGAITADEPKIRAFALLFVIGIVHNQLLEIVRTLRQIRRDIELVKGGVRENRFYLHRWVWESRDKN